MCANCFAIAIKTETITVITLINYRVRLLLCGIHDADFFSASESLSNFAEKLSNWVYDYDDFRLKRSILIFSHLIFISFEAINCWNFAEIVKFFFQMFDFIWYNVIGLCADNR